MRSLKLFSQLLVLGLLLSAAPGAKAANPATRAPTGQTAVVSVTDVGCGFWGQRLYLRFSGLPTVDGRYADQSAYRITVPRRMSCEAFAADVLNQIRRVGNRFQARIEVNSYEKTVEVCAENGEHSDCTRHISITRRSLLLPGLQVNGKPFIVGKNI